MTPRLAAAGTGLGLRALALVALLAACLGLPRATSLHRPDLIVLADRSTRATAERVQPIVAGLVSREGGEVQVSAYGPAPSEDVAAAPGIPGNLAQAVWSALARRDPDRGLALAIVSDGRGDPADAAGALAAARDAGVPAYWLPAGPAAGDVEILSVAAPSAVRIGTPIAVEVLLRARHAMDAELSARTPDGRVASRVVSLGAGLPAAARLELAATHRGALRIAIAAGATDGARPVAGRECLVDVLGPPRVAYIGDPAGPLAGSLQDGGFDVDRFRPARAPGSVEVLSGYSLAVLDDVAVEQATAAFWTSLVAAVQERGLGLLVLGGPHAFAAGGYRNSALESVLPTLSEPAALESPAHVVFLVDKSGSMGSVGPSLDRLAQARAAVAGTAATFAARDQVALIAFDTTPRLLMPLREASGDAVEALRQPWPVVANGGTLLAPALEAAADLLERSSAGERLVILVTDGFLADETMAAVRERLARMQARVIALSLGNEADPTALGELARATRGRLIHVPEAAALRLRMRDGLQQIRSRTRRGPVRAVQRVALPAPVPALADWPDVAGYTVVRTRPGATAHVVADNGDPLLAAWRAGSGQVVAVTSGLGPWTPAWLAWSHWPDLAGGLAAWAARDRLDPGLGITVASEGSQLKLLIDAARDRRWEVADTPSIRLVTPSGQVLAPVLTPAGPGRFVADLPDAEPGVYEIDAMAGAAHTSRAHLHDPGAAGEVAAQRWLEAGLVQPWPAGGLDSIEVAVHAMPGGRGRVAILGLVLYLAALAVDYRGALLAPGRRLRRALAGAGRMMSRLAGAAWDVARSTRPQATSAAGS